MTSKKIDISQARTEADLLEIGAFRYACYHAEGMIAPRADRMFIDEFDRCDTTHLFMLRHKGRLVGSIRLQILDAHSHESATMRAFSDIVMPRISSGQSVIDGARFVVAPDLGALRLSIARHSLRLYETFAEKRGVDYGIAAVTQERVEFYRRIFGFTQIGEARDYGQLTQKLVLIGVDLNKRREQKIAAE